MNRWYVGIDAGGSKTAAVALSQVGAVLGRARAGSGSLTTQPPAAVAAVFAMALSEAAREAGFDAAAEPPSAAMVGIAGFSNESGRIELQTRLASAWPKTSWYVVPDYVTAWYGASGGTPSACVIAGTGSVAYGRNDAGDEVRLDGLGYLLGDVGGAVKLVLDAILNNLDLPAGDSPTSLGRAMMLEAGVTLAADIIPWVYADFSPARVAALAPLIGRLADAGDPHAIRVIRRHGFRLRRLALQTVQRLQFRH
ncbi:MAG: hypothetical protein KGK12_14740, partial [Armatimonadetes bacterium]|nr:hypothetical protein [Armatimonadota bacterium]